MKQNYELRGKLEGKRLLLLGGSLLKDAIKVIADTYGIVLIAAGNTPSSDVFSIAQETYVVDSTDANAMKKLIVDKRIDGAYMGGSEPVIAAACVYLHDLGLPCYCTKEQWDTLQDKACFKELCIKHGLPVVPQYKLKESELAGFTDFPVITKPTNSCGSSGFSVCRNAAELRVGYRKAKEDSPTGDVIIERFVKNEAVVVFYTVCDGEIRYSGLEDKYSVQYENQQSYVGGLFVFESALANDFRAKFEEKIAAMVSDLGIREGNFWMEVFTDGENYYFNETGFRAGGSGTVYPINYMHGINQVAADMYYALTGEGVLDGFPSIIPARIPRKKNYAIYSVFANAGIVCDIKGVKDFENNENIVHVIVRKHVGDSMQETGTFAQVIALVHFVFDTKEELEETIADIYKKVQMIDQDGNNMMQQVLNLETVQLR